VQHLLHGDPVENLAPPVDRLGLLLAEPLRGAVLEAELGEQVLAHDHVLELGCLREQPPQVLPVGDDDPRLGEALGLGHAPIVAQPVKAG
jgi:hypothetical protein